MRAALLVLTCALAACSQGPDRRDYYTRVLNTAPGKAQPSRIVARELELLNLSREEGPTAASAELAAQGATVLSPAGRRSANSLAAMVDQNGALMPWEPRVVWISCDSELAVTKGRFTTMDGLVGSYLSVWQRSERGEYQWLYNAAQVDDPQPQAPPPRPAPQPGDIVVTSIDSIEGNVADCAENSAINTAVPIEFDAVTSPDRTLQWQWSYEQGVRHFRVFAMNEGQWSLVLDQKMAASEQGSVQ